MEHHFLIYRLLSTRMSVKISAAKLKTNTREGNIEIPFFTFFMLTDIYSISQYNLSKLTNFLQKLKYKLANDIIDMSLLKSIFATYV